MRGEDDRARVDQSARAQTQAKAGGGCTDGHLADTVNAAVEHASRRRRVRIQIIANDDAGAFLGSGGTFEGLLDSRLCRSGGPGGDR